MRFAGRKSCIVLAATGAVLLSSACRPEGVLERGVGSSSGMHITGWARDPDSPDPIQIHAYVDGVFAASTTANLPRPDVQAARDKAGPAHGFAIDVPAGPGFHEVCIYGIDLVGDDESAAIGCWPLIVRAEGDAPGPLPDGPKSISAVVNNGDPCAPEHEGKYAKTPISEIVRCGRTLIDPDLRWYSV